MRASLLGPAGPMGTAKVVFAAVSATAPGLDCVGSRPAGDCWPRLVVHQLPLPHADPLRIGELACGIAAADEVTAKVGVAGGLPGVLVAQINVLAHPIGIARQAQKNRK